MVTHTTRLFQKTIQIAANAAHSAGKTGLSGIGAYGFRDLRLINSGGPLQRSRGVILSHTISPRGQVI